MIDKAYEVAQEKLSCAASLLDREGIDAWLVLTREGSDPSMPLLFGVRSVHPAALFIMRDGAHKALVSHSDRGNYASTGLFPEVIEYGTSFEESLSALLKSLDPRKLALNFSLSDNLCDGLTTGLYLLLERVVGAEKLARIEVSAEALLKELRSRKSPAELARIEEAIRITLRIYDEVFGATRIGMSEREIGELFISGFRRHGVTNGHGSYDPPIVCIVRAGLAHRKPGDTTLVPGDILICDTSVSYEGYASDIARTAYALKPGEKRAPADVEHAFRTARDAVSAVIAFLKPGRKGFEVDAVGRGHIEAGGFPTIRHSTGHQIGRNVHDGGTRLGPKKAGGPPEADGVVAAGEVYAVEPTVIQDGGLPCMIVEENMVVLDDGVRVLSERQTELVLISR
jgi:Xaa-Pro aminopeptidase